jgi:glycosyltransferase involved in cell wall biosynthesis
MEGWQTQLVAAPLIDVPSRLGLTVLLPAYNEELAIRGVLEEIVETLSAGCDGEPIEYEILVVDDASTDRTAEVVEQFAAECWQCAQENVAVRLIRCPENRGAGAARKVGIRAARGELIVMLDADGTYPAAAIPELLRHFPAYDQVNGARTSERGTLPWLRTAAKWLIRMLACYLTGKKIPDLNTGLKAFRRDAMLPWLWVVPDGFSCVTTMTLAFLTNGYAVKYVPVEYRRRIGHSKFHPLRDTLSYLSTVLRIVLYFRPLKIFMPLAGLMVSLGAVKSLWSFYATTSMQESDIVVLVAGFLTGMLGLLAEVIVAHHRR